MRENFGRVLTLLIFIVVVLNLIKVLTKITGKIAWLMKYLSHKYCKKNETIRVKPEMDGEEYKEETQ